MEREREREKEKEKKSEDYRTKKCYEKLKEKSKIKKTGCPKKRHFQEKLLKPYYF